MGLFTKKVKEKGITQEEIMEEIKSIEENKWDEIKKVSKKIKEYKLGGYQQIGFGWNANIASLEALLELKERIEQLEKEREK